MTKVKKGNKIKGVTLPEFNKVTLGTLRAWHAYWSNADRCKGNKAITEERPVAEHLRLIKAEIEARGAKV